MLKAKHLIQNNVASLMEEQAIVWYTLATEKEKALENNTFAQEAEDVNNPIISNSSGSSSSSFSIGDLNSAFVSKVDGSLIYFDNTASTFKADNTTTKTNIVDGGNF